MDRELLQKLNDQLKNNWKERDINIKKTLNGLLRRRSNRKVILNLSEAIKTGVFADKNKAVLITTLALIRRDLDCKHELQNLLSDYNLINLLYGGLIKLLDGKSETFKIEIQWNYDSYENKYEFIERFPVPEHWNFIDLIITSSILIETDSKKFENLLIKDSTNLLLLNFLHGEEGWIISEGFIKRLLKNETCGLRRNVGFHILIEPIERIVATGVNSRKSKTDFNNKVNNFNVIFDDIPLNFKAEMLINYFLTNKRADSILTFLAKEIMKSELVDDLVTEIKSNKIRQLDDLYIVLFITKSVRTRRHGDKSSKNKLYNSILKKLQEFIEDNEGIYTWDDYSKSLFREIYIILPNKYKNQLENSIMKIKGTLMVSKLDRLVRFELYISDQKRNEILDGMLDVIKIERSI
ncbi:hypothetical protein [Caryophanon latum]|uniref:Uncharacterized protein n=1 Tax=Caryophanon latum TaxID=33977 RepID=A0A1C0YNW3_9BACL|nr:hypothetical protein [Caryophanon latum]OCS88858.1 hypothetical protein A6K76_13655 [Caryophanon latum]